MRVSFSFLVKAFCSMRLCIRAPRGSYAAALLCNLERLVGFAPFFVFVPVASSAARGLALSVASLAMLNNSFECRKCDFYGFNIVLSTLY